MKLRCKKSSQPAIKKSALSSKSNVQFKNTKVRHMSLFQLTKECLHANSLRNFLYICNLIPLKKQCPSCGNPMKLTFSRKAIIGDFRCQRVKRHKNKQPVRISQGKHTWFEGVNISVEKILILTYAFVHRFTYNQAINECGLNEDDTIISSATVADWYSYCREMCVIALDKSYDAEGNIGGDGHLVEIDEMKLGRRKYHRGRVVEGNWILGFIDRDTKDFRLEICPDNKRDEPTLRRLINKHVEKGTEINTDGWAAYSFLKEDGYTHSTVIHDREFVAADGTHTNNIESQWRPLRRRLSRGGIRKEYLADHMCEFLWHREQYRFERDPFLSLLTVISEVCNGSPPPA